MQATEIKYLRTLGVTRKDKIRNTTIRKELGVQPALKFIEQRQLSWWKHIQRMDNNGHMRRKYKQKGKKKARTNTCDVSQNTNSDPKSTRKALIKNELKRIEAFFPSPLPEKTERTSAGIDIENTVN
ncbi:hypothetical protein WA026_010021 [Henosepilachna vigintioctopunctata]|uniref:Uncharacterized protein n=1 Tax=Henosepilachna vigintioctopunctata TaxID=420089 RepID=A0AAW1TRU9_9CUCU